MEDMSVDDLDDSDLVLQILSIVLSVCCVCSSSSIVVTSALSSLTLWSPHWHREGEIRHRSHPAQAFVVYDR